MKRARLSAVNYFMTPGTVGKILLPILVFLVVGSVVRTALGLGTQQLSEQEKQTEAALVPALPSMVLNWNDAAMLNGAVSDCTAKNPAGSIDVSYSGGGSDSDIRNVETGDENLGDQHGESAFCAGDVFIASTVSLAKTKSMQLAWMDVDSSLQHADDADAEGMAESLAQGASVLPGSAKWLPMNTVGSYAWGLKFRATYSGDSRVWDMFNISESQGLVTSAIVLRLPVVEGNDAIVTQVAKSVHDHIQQARSRAEASAPAS